jgi:accessory colonization factor AcfC
MKPALVRGFFRAAFNCCPWACRKRVRPLVSRPNRRLPAVLLAASLVAAGGREFSAQAVVRVYSSEGPAPALREAAASFATNEAVKGVGGPPSEWMARATANADVVCSSADFMRSEFLRNTALQVDPATVTPLYRRPSAILVRPGNPVQSMRKSGTP